MEENDPSSSSSRASLENESHLGSYSLNQKENIPTFSQMGENIQNSNRTSISYIDLSFLEDLTTDVGIVQSTSRTNISSIYLSFLEDLTTEEVGNVQSTSRTNISSIDLNFLSFSTSESMHISNLTRAVENVQSTSRVNISSTNENSLDDFSTSQSMHDPTLTTVLDNVPSTSRSNSLSDYEIIRRRLKESPLYPNEAQLDDLCRELGKNKKQVTTLLHFLEGTVVASKKSEKSLRNTELNDDKFSQDSGIDSDEDMMPENVQSTSTTKANSDNKNRQKIYKKNWSKNNKIIKNWVKKNPAYPDENQLIELCRMTSTKKVQAIRIVNRLRKQNFEKSKNPCKSLGNKGKSSQEAKTDLDEGPIWSFSHLPTVIEKFSCTSGTVSGNIPSTSETVSWNFPNTSETVSWNFPSTNETVLKKIPSNVGNANIKILIEWLKENYHSSYPTRLLEEQYGLKKRSDSAST